MPPGGVLGARLQPNAGCGLPGLGARAPVEQPRKGTSVTAGLAALCLLQPGPPQAKQGSLLGGSTSAPTALTPSPPPFRGPRHTSLAVLITGSGEPLTPVSNVQPHTPVPKGSSRASGLEASHVPPRSRCFTGTRIPSWPSGTPVFLYLELCSAQPVQPYAEAQPRGSSRLLRAAPMPETVEAPSLLRGPSQGADPY